MVSLRRAVSSCYYALFHCLARECANLLIGGPGSARSDEAWHQVYRSLEHGPAKDRCRNQGMVRKFPSDIQDFATQFVAMQTKRHDADYAPNVIFAKSDIEKDIIAVEQAMRRFMGTQVRDRRAFCAYVLLKQRSS